MKYLRAVIIGFSLGFILAAALDSNIFTIIFVAIVGQGALELLGGKHESTG